MFYTIKTSYQMKVKSKSLLTIHLLQIAEKSLKLQIAFVFYWKEQPISVLYEEDLATNNRSLNRHKDSFIN